MNNITTAYSHYYYDRYKLANLLVNSPIRSARILSNNLLDISRSMHMSPKNWIDYPHSSLRVYFYDDVPDWLNKKHIADKYGSAVKYLEFCKK
jgi:hypothetical protein